MLYIIVVESLIVRASPKIWRSYDWIYYAV